jgi:hypothetical protein
MTPAPPNAGGDLFAANLKGALLAVASSAFIGVSFIVKKKGLRRAGASGTRAGTHVPGISVASNQKAPPFFFVSLSLVFVISVIIMGRLSASNSNSLLRFDF